MNKNDWLWLLAAALILLAWGYTSNEDYYETERVGQAYCERVELGAHRDYEGLCK